MPHMVSAWSYTSLTNSHTIQYLFKGVVYATRYIFPPRVIRYSLIFSQN